jgi:acyl-CoA synthetase (AMP-forming)/AMP-acid ligase II
MIFYFRKFIVMSDFSYLCSPRTTPYTYKTITQVFHETSTLFPNKEILIKRGIDGNRESLTCSELQTKATKLATYLVQKGIRKGDKIAISGPNTLEWVIAELGIILAGGVAVHVPFYASDARDVYELVSITECKAFIIDPGKQDEYLDTILQLIALLHRPYPNSCDMEEDSNDLTFVFLRKSHHLASYDDLPGILQLNESKAEFPTLYPEDDIVIFTTSGSTGKPKLIPKTHFHATNNDFIFSDKTYNDCPFPWSAGSPIFTLYQGEPRVFSDSSLTVEGRNTMEIWGLIKEEECKSALLLPYYLSDLVAHKENYKDPFKLDVIITCGQAVSNLQKQVAGIFTRNLKITYGLSETNGVSIISYTGTGSEIHGEAGDVGEPLPGKEVKIIDRNENVLRKGENGDICVRSICGFEKYDKNPEINKEVLLPGMWFRTGDVGHINEHNHIIIQGRTKDFISRGARKILPSSIEEIIITKSGIKDVCVVGVPDRRLHEEICVCYVTNPEHHISPADVKQFCEEKFIGHHAADGHGKMPRYFLRFHSLPLVAIGKINKRQLRIDAIKLLDLDDQVEG